MKIKVIGCMAMVICTIIISCQSEDQLEFKRYYIGGKLLYEQKCQNCHGANGEGLSGLIPPLTDSVYLKKNKATLACVVKYGIKETIITIKGKSYEGTMPATDLAPVEIAKILTYLGNSFGNKMNVITSEQVDADINKCN